MKPCFRENGRVTAATSSQTSDGAAFLVLMSRDKAAEMGIRPLASFLGFCVGGLDPAYMGLGPIYAAPKVLEYTGLTMDDMDVIELNEAFAAPASGSWAWIPPGSTPTAAPWPWATPWVLPARC